MKFLYMIFVVIFISGSFAFSQEEQKEENSYPKFIPYVQEVNNLQANTVNMDIKDYGKEQPARWLSVDPMANKYPGWSPYNYCYNNPSAVIDPNGDSVVINNVDWQNDLRNTVPKALRKYVQFDDKGKFDITLAKKQKSDDINFKALLEIGEAKEIVNISESGKFQYKDCDGNIINYNMNGFNGFTTAPDNSKYSSVDNNINVQINKSIDPEKRAESIAHEAYGHVTFLIEGKYWIHDYPKTGGGKDLNIPLSDAIIRYMQQAEQNYKDK